MSDAEPRNMPEWLPGETPAEYHVRIQGMMADYAPVTTNGRTAIVAEQTHNKTGRILEACRASGEPIFVLRAKDILSNMVIAEYLEKVDKYTPTNHKLQGQVAEILDQFLEWQKSNMNQVRYPD